MHWWALPLTCRHKPLICIHLQAKLSPQTSPSDPQTKTHTHLYQSTPCGFQPLQGIWWNSAQVCMLSRGLQCSSPNREPRTSQILPGITPSSSLFSLLSMRFLSGSDSLSESLVLFTSFYLSSSLLSLSTSPLLVLLPSLIFLTLDLWALFVSQLPPLLGSALQRRERSRKRKNCVRVAVYWRGEKGNNTDLWKID